MKEDVKLIIKTGDDIMIEGIDQAQMVAIVDDGDSFRLKDEGGVIYVRANSEAKLSVPRSADVTVEWAGGDAGLLNLTKNVFVQKVGGDLTLQNVLSASVDTVNGDCYCKNIAGLLDVHRVGGDLDGTGIDSVKALAIGGDIVLSEVAGAVDIKAGGDIHLQFNKAEVSEAHLQASGDIYLEVAEGTNAVLNMKSYGEDIDVNACGQKLETEQQEYTLPLGEGGPVLELNAQGDIRVGEGHGSTSEFTFDFEDLGETWHDFGREIEEKIRESMKNVNESLKHAGWEANEAMQRATDKIRSKEGKVYGFSFDKGSAPAPKKEKKVVSDEERMMVLKMLQDKKISVEEAEKLLQALER
jgi:hypothetical protein